MFLCGEPFKLDVMDYCFQKLKLKNVYNFYGLTETGVENFYYKCQPGDREKYHRHGMLPIGKVLPGNDAMISDEKELMISGCQITPGYLNNAMQEKIVNIEGKDWFKTGDIAEIHDDLYFCKGRIDSQIKIGGHRVELLDIEVNIVKHIESIKQATCFIKELKNHRIIAALLVGNQELQIDVIQNHLLKHIPKYMVPQMIHYVTELPTNSNGKIDRRRIAELFDEIAKSKQMG